MMRERDEGGHDAGGLMRDRKHSGETTTSSEQMPQPSFESSSDCSQQVSAGRAPAAAEESVPMWMLNSTHKSTQRLLVAAADYHAQAKAAREFYRRASHEEVPSIPLTTGGFVAPPPLLSLRSKSSSSKSGPSATSF